MRLMSPDELEAALRRIGAERYHARHPFHRLLHEGRLERGQVQAWALNRYYYQSRIPIKDAALLARLPTPELRRAWRQRLVDHDGEAEGEGGIARWLALTDGLGLDRDYVVSTRGILPATKFAVEAYVHFVRERSLLEAIASSLTELFAPAITARSASKVRLRSSMTAPTGVAPSQRLRISTATSSGSRTRSGASSTHASRRGSRRSLTPRRSRGTLASSIAAGSLIPPRPPPAGRRPAARAPG